MDMSAFEAIAKAYTDDVRDTAAELFGSGCHPNDCLTIAQTIAQSRARRRAEEGARLVPPRAPFGRSLIGALLLALLPVVASAQTPVPAIQVERLGWDQRATADELPRMSFAIFVDGVRAPIVATCVQSTTDQASCSGPLPAMTPGLHTLELIAIVSEPRPEGAPLVIESPRSLPFQVRMVIGPEQPTRLRIDR